MWSIPYFLRGPFRNAMLMALEETSSSEPGVWKLCLIVAKNAPPQATQVWNHPQVQIGPDFRNLPMDNGQICCGKALKVLRQPPL